MNSASGQASMIVSRAAGAQSRCTLRRPISRNPKVSPA